MHIRTLKSVLSAMGDVLSDASLRQTWAEFVSLNWDGVWTAADDASQVRKNTRTDKYVRAGRTQT